MESSTNLPIGLPEFKTAEPDDQPLSHPIAVDVEKEPSQPIVQRAEDNPRAGEPIDPRVESDISSAPSTAPAIQVLQPPHLPPRTFTNSQWARRNARIKAIRSFFPEKVVAVLCAMALGFLIL